MLTASERSRRIADLRKRRVDKCVEYARKAFAECVPGDAPSVSRFRAGLLQWLADDSRWLEGMGSRWLAGIVQRSGNSVPDGWWKGERAEVVSYCQAQRTGIAAWIQRALVKYERRPAHPQRGPDRRSLPMSEVMRAWRRDGVWRDWPESWPEVGNRGMAVMVRAAGWYTSRHGDGVVVVGAMLADPR